MYNVVFGVLMPVGRVGGCRRGMYQVCLASKVQCVLHTWLQPSTKKGAISF